MVKQIGVAIVNPTGGTLPLSAGIEVDGVVYLSGQLAMSGGKLVEGCIGDQTGTAIDQIVSLLAEAGLGLGDVVKSTIWLTRAEDFAGFNAVYGARFAVPYPARSTVIAGLVLPGALVEIEVIARRR